MNRIIGLLLISSVLLHSFTVEAGTFTGLHVSGNQLVNGNGQVVKLRGVNRSGTEYACIQGWGFEDGPYDAASIQAMLSWKVNAVRIPLNEDCWLGINGSPGAYSGSNYQNFLLNYINLISSYDMAVIIDLHWTNSGGGQSNEQQPMPDQDHALTFWSSVASFFKGHSNVIFDAFNEPYPDNNNWNSQQGWLCWRNGGNDCPGLWYTAAGMQYLVDAIRSTGATNVIMLGGLAYSNSLAQFLTYVPYDKLGNIAASWHSYSFNYCNNLNCWQQYVVPVAQKVPLIVGEVGEANCGTTFLSQLLPWLDSIGASYLGWAWDAWSNNCPQLITDYSGTCKAGMGCLYKSHLQSQSESENNQTALASNAVLHE